MKLPGAASVDRFLHPLVASTILLGVLLIWQRTFDQSCLALVFPGLVCIAIFFGQLEYRLERKRFAVDYYFDPGSSLRGRFQGSWLPVLISVVTAVPLGIFLVVFAALSRYTDWLFLGLTAAIAPLLFVGLSSWPGRHFRRDDEGSGGIAIAEILTARLAGWILMALIVVTYVYLNYRSFLVRRTSTRTPFSSRSRPSRPVATRRARLWTAACVLPPGSKDSRGIL